ncbi:MAG: hypothetical protein IKQ46_10465 [Bacteroidales bacterium]|nr:hypothetical protein [Bacteroidales bacterium]
MIDKIFKDISQAKYTIGYRSKWLTNTIDTIIDIKKHYKGQQRSLLDFVNPTIYNKLEFQEFLLGKIRTYLHKNDTLEFNMADVYDYLIKDDFYDDKDKEEIKKAIINMVLNDILIPEKLAS